MISWIESKETAVIALIVFGIYYAVTAVIFVVAAMLHKRERAAHLKATSPVMLTPLSVFAGLLIAFLASRVWSNLDRAQTDVVQEASALHEVVLILNSLPADISVTVRKSMRCARSSNGTINTTPGPRWSIRRPRRKTTARSYSLSTLSPLRTKTITINTTIPTPVVISLSSRPRQLDC